MPLLSDLMSLLSPWRYSSCNDHNAVVPRRVVRRKVHPPLDGALSRSPLTALGKSVHHLLTLSRRSSQFTQLNLSLTTSHRKITTGPYSSHSSYVSYHHFMLLSSMIFQVSQSCIANWESPRSLPFGALFSSALCLSNVHILKPSLCHSAVVLPPGKQTRCNLFSWRVAP